MGYVLAGILWCWWLEYYTTKMGMSTWIWRERMFHTALWPVSLSIFVYNFFKGLW